MFKEEAREDPFEIMEQKLLPVFREAVSIAKEISKNTNYFKDDYKAARRLYAMAVVSLIISSVNSNNISDEQKKKNIENINLVNERYFYQANGSLGKKENIFKRPEIEIFKHEMKNLNAGYFDDACIQKCLGDVEADVAVGIWNENQPIVSPDGKILNWKNASKSNIFRFATDEIKNNMFIRKMNNTSRENNWNKKEWDTNYPIVNRECEKLIELEITKYCKNRQDIFSLDLSKSR